MKKLIIFSVLFLFCEKGLAEPTCVFNFSNRDSVKVKWTAFKTTEKVPVSGSLNKFKISGKQSANSLGKLLEQQEIIIDSQSVDSGLQKRDQTLVNFFFSLFNEREIKASVVSVAEDKIKARLSLNKTSKLVELSYSVSGDKRLVATGEINVLDFGLSNALSSLNEECKILHSGADGISQTWSTVEISIEAAIERSCENS